MTKAMTTGSAAHPEKKIDSEPASNSVAKPDNTITTNGTPRKRAGLAHPVNTVCLIMATALDQVEVM
jgi:hypothetical protein